ncbi:MAG TPA: hypothetical protein P5064_05230 [Clostridia bacterium]|jgi:hypothetical protein|nr:hypothetical protein [Clostridiaceae bacterium]HOF27296.1 hypothetical protein [Clostridia bacterium]HOM34137.1 hypothetical protein [Clostridia bacterium]HOR90468.1 hypothetical protein [Clostridia bacterium]HOT70685.1 hypothetical protein [Clostridia bacterium]
MKYPDILFYGERGILNGILMDIYRNRESCKKVNKFFGAIKLLNRKEVPWKNITSCKWLVEPDLSEFGAPDLIAVLESDGKKYALFIEAKLDKYTKSSFHLPQKVSPASVKRYSSRLNVQLSFRYRFVEAFKEIPKDNKGHNTQEIIETSQHWDEKMRKLAKLPVITEMKNFLKGVEEYYFIALTNDFSSEKVISEIEKKQNIHPPLYDGSYEEFKKHQSKFGVLTYRDLEDIIVGKCNGNNNEELSSFCKACKMMDMKIANDCNELQTNTPGSPKAQSININKWNKDLKKLAEEFVKKSHKYRFSKQAGSYSLKVGGEVVIKLIQHQQNENYSQVGNNKKLMLGFSDPNVLLHESDLDETKIQALSIGVGERCKTFHFYPVEENNMDKMIGLVNKYCK